jgi:uncharacterized protein YlzI (FlbEa/FlbD family)
VQPAIEPVVHAMPPPVTVPRPVPEVLAVRSQVAGWNVAVTVLAPVIETVQVFPDTVVQPLHDQKIDPASGVAVSVTAVAGEVFATWAVQPSVEPVVQAMPPPVTVPRPVPEVLAVRSHVAGWNVAVTVLAMVIETVHVFPDTAVQPLHDQKIDPASGAAVSVTTAPPPRLALQPAVDPVVQEMPSPVTVPRPVPEVRTVSGNVTREKVVPTVRASVMATTQVAAVPVQAPLQPEKTEPDAARAVSVTVDPAGKSAAHAAPQSIPAGLEVTVPTPLPPRETVSVKAGGVSAKLRTKTCATVGVLGSEAV